MNNIVLALETAGIHATYKGKGVMIKCPFHDDHNPSLQVFENGFKCYACGETGNIKKLFVELGIEKYEEPDALRSMVNKLTKSLNTKLHCLAGLPDAKPFDVDYRGIKSEIYMANNTFTTEPDTVCFPLYDLDMNYRGYVKNIFGGKYINYFTNGYVPYNLHRLNSASPIIVEGIYDALSVMQLGYNNVIATLGTGQIWNVARILRKIKATNVHILFDNDSNKAGQYAAKRLSEIYRNSKIIEIPEPNEDPNSFSMLKDLLEHEYDLHS